MNQEAAQITLDFIRTGFYKSRSDISIVKTEVCESLPVISNHEPGFESADHIWLKHRKIEFITYPYEWPFQLLKRAALFHLELLVEAIDAGYIIKDSSAFNIQFRGTEPIFVDLPSFEPYEEGCYWIGYKQFCEQFLAPLVLENYTQVQFNDWFRGRLDGLNVTEVSSTLPISSYFSLSVLSHIHIQGKFLAKRTAETSSPKAQKDLKPIRRQNLLALIKGLQEFISTLEPRKQTFWKHYAQNTSYSSDSEAFKKQFVKNFCKQSSVNRVIDLGCNSGIYSKVSLQNGVKSVIGLDVDAGALNQAAIDPEFKRQNFIPLLFDIANPSPDCGWANKERANIKSRLPKVDAIICLALVHHLAIGRNIPLDFILSEITKLADQGVIEFVPKEDLMVQQLLLGRPDIFPDYNCQEFEELLQRRASSVSRVKIPGSARILYTYRI